MSNLPPKQPDPKHGAGLGILLGPQRGSKANTQTRAEPRAADGGGPTAPGGQEQGSAARSHSRNA